MKKLSLALIMSGCAMAANAQVVSNATYLKAMPKAQVNIPFRYNDEGVKTPIEWGLDLAWLSEDNVRIGINYAGKDVVDIMRLSFQATASVEDGKFSTKQTTDLNKRINIVKKYCKSGIGYNINCDHPSLDDWYNDQSQTSAERAARWVKLMDMSADYYKSKGLTNLVSISPLNEPDYEWHLLPTYKNRKADFKAMCKIFKEDEAYKEKYADVRMCGGNTLNDDQAYSWWNYMKPYIDEGNTHQLAGNFDNYASFFQKVREYGNHATNDELHNVMEAMVGVEYGMQTGIWWGTAERTRGDFMKATWQGNPGDRLGYGEHRNNWTAASVYRHPSGRVQAFLGTSERQAVATTYNFAAIDQPVWYNGQRGREFTMKVKGGTGYQNGQTNYETCLDIQGGEDVMPALVEGTYKIVNAYSGLVMGFTSNPGTGWVSIKQVSNAASNPVHQQWKLYEVANKIDNYGGDESYFVLQLNTNTPLYLDILNWGLNAGADLGTIAGGLGGNEQWYFEYAGDGAFYILSRHSTKCIEVAGSSTLSGGNIQMGDLKKTKNQMWKLIAVDAKPDKKAPAIPADLVATPQNASVKLSWTAPSDTDLKSYTILRSEDGEKYITLCNEIVGTEFVDNEAADGRTYYYKVYAEDKSLNRSKHSDAVTAVVSGDKGLVMAQVFADSTFYDSSVNGNHAAYPTDKPTYTTTKERTGITLNGSSDFIQLAPGMASRDAITVATWIYYRGGNAWQRIFDFGNGTDQYMFLTPNDGSRMKFVIKNGGAEEAVRPSTVKKPATTGWTHVAITLADGVGILYMNGVEVGRNEAITIKPSDINPAFNYIGRSQFAADPMLKAHVQNFHVYNYALSPEEIVAQMNGEETGIKNIEDGKLNIENSYLHTNSYDLSGRKTMNNARGITIKNGKKRVR